MSSFRLPPARYVAIALGVIVSTHYLVSFTSPVYASHTSLSAVRDRFSYATGHSTTWIDGKLSNGGANSQTTTTHGNGRINSQIEGMEKELGNSTRRANAAFVILARNSELWDIVASIRGVEGTLVAPSRSRECTADEVVFRSIQQKVQLSLRLFKRRRILGRFQETYLWRRFRTMYLWSHTERTVGR